MSLRIAPALSTAYIQADMKGLRLAEMLAAIANGFDETNAEVGDGADFGRTLLVVPLVTGSKAKSPRSKRALNVRQF